jgi:hypothetical protein
MIQPGHSAAQVLLGMQQDRELLGGYRAQVHAGEFVEDLRQPIGQPSDRIIGNNGHSRSPLPGVRIYIRVYSRS